MKETEERYGEEARLLWGNGEWDNEPDKVQYVSVATGYPCLIVRNYSGALCGYVGVPEGHVWHGVGYDDVPADCHGGLTFSGKCQENGHICHKVEPGEPDNVWWLGFDCSHGGDLVPAICKLYEDLGKGPHVGMGREDTYKNIAYVRREIAGIARQAVMADMESWPRP